MVLNLRLPKRYAYLCGSPLDFIFSEGSGAAYYFDHCSLRQTKNKSLVTGGAIICLRHRGDGHNNACFFLKGPTACLYT